MRYVLKILGMPADTVNRPAPELESTYVKSFNPDAFDGRGELVVTRDVSQAIDFDTQESAFLFWGKTPTLRATRPYGKPNRPLSAYHMVIQQVKPLANARVKPKGPAS
jgi:hypothetical protein